MNFNAKSEETHFEFQTEFAAEVLFGSNLCSFVEAFLFGPLGNRCLERIEFESEFRRNKKKKTIHHRIPRSKNHRSTGCMSNANANRSKAQMSALCSVKR